MNLLTLPELKFILKLKPIFGLLLILYVPCCLHAQSAPATYPKITAYVGTIHPIVTYSKDKPVYNFDGAYVGGLPTGINIWKSTAIGFSFESR
jgi:hypothetical protein